MSSYPNLGPIVRVADGAIAEFTIVALTASNGVAQSTAHAANDDGHGVVQYIKGAAVDSGDFGAPAVAGDRVDVHMHGRIKVTLGATHAAGTLCGADAQGRAIAVGAGEFGVVTLLEGGAVNEIVDAFITLRQG